MLKKLQITFLLLIFIFTLSGCGNSSKKNPSKKITLNYWRSWDETDDFSDIIQEYNAKHPTIDIKYRKIQYENYEKELINALAEDRGPDIFSINHNQIKEYQNKLAAMPSSVTVSKLVINKTPIKEEKYLELETKKMMSIGDLENKFIDVVSDDVVEYNEKDLPKIYGLPLSVDTLVMYYNKDLFNNAGIANAPKYWDRDFQKTVKSLTKQDVDGNILQSGIALGTAYNIERSSDIIAILMLQNGTTIMDENGVVTINKAPSGSNGYQPALGALRFYTDFSNTTKEVYCWNNELDDSLKDFAEGNVGIMFGYSYHKPLIKMLSPKLKFNIAPLPQIKGSTQTTNIADYQVEVVSKKSEYKDEAWDFIQFMTSEKQVVKYLNKTKKPTALRSLIQKQLDDDDVKIFAEQLLTSKSWYEGYNYKAAEDAIKKMITEANTAENEKALADTIQIASSRIQQTTQKPNIIQ